MHAAKVLIALFCALSLAAGALAAAITTPAVSTGSVELSPSVQLVGKYDWEIIKTDTGDSWSRCLDMVWRAAEAKSSRLNFVPTHHWLPDEAAANGISSFCFIDTVVPASEATDTTNQYKCFPWSQAVIEEYTHAMKVCFAEALRQGLTIYVRPHLDDGTLKGAWRNGLLLEPNKKYGGCSYYDIMLAPLADALREAIAITTAEGSIKPPPGRDMPTVYFATQGEMSATIMRFASDWSKLIPGLRQRIKGDNSDVDIKMGVGLNFNRLDDTTSVEKQWGSSRLSWLAWQVGLEAPAGSREGVPSIDVEALRQMFTQQLDFLGISAYAPYNGGGSFTLDQFENSAFILCDEMKEVYGIDVKGLANSGKLELQYSEFGIGGGAGYAGGQLARTPAEVALRPFFGVYGPYKTSTDPWAIPAIKAFRQQFHYKALQWLADPKIKTHKISSVFVWSMASWDVLGVYPESTTDEGSYRDPDVFAAVATYNEAVKAAQGSTGQRDSSKSSKPDPSGSSGDSGSKQESEGQGAALAAPSGADAGKGADAGAGPATDGVRVVVVGPDGAQEVRPASG